MYCIILECRKRCVQLARERAKRNGYRRRVGKKGYEIGPKGCISLQAAYHTWGGKSSPRPEYRQEGGDREVSF